MSQSQAIQTQKDLAERMKRFRDRMYDQFINNLTPRQRKAWHRSNAVPKAMAHQKRFKDYTLAKQDYNVERFRASFHIVERAAV